MSKTQEETNIRVPEGYVLAPVTIDLEEMRDLFGFNPQTIKRERYLQKQIQSGKNINGQRYNPDGLGFKLQPIQYTKNGSLRYYTKDVVNYIADHQQPSPEENLKVGSA